MIANLLWMKVYGLVTVLSCCSLQTVYSANCKYDPLPVTRDWKVLQTPEFPSKFPPETRCSWRLVAEENYRIKLQFRRYSLVPAGKDEICSWQWLEIVDGEKNPKIEKQGYIACGLQSPGTLVSSGNVLYLGLYSNSASASQKYEGFEASYAMTQDKSSMPEEAKSNFLSESDRKDKLAPTRRTLGSVLDKLRPKKKTGRRLTQNERIELRNQRINGGLDVNAENLVLDEFGNVISDENGNIITEESKLENVVSTATTPYIKPKRRRATLSNEVRTVIIVVGIIVGAFLLIALVVKFDVISKISALRNNCTDEERDGNKENPRNAECVFSRENDIGKNKEQNRNLKKNKTHHHKHSHSRHHRRHHHRSKTRMDDRERNSSSLSRKLSANEERQRTADEKPAHHHRQKKKNFDDFGKCVRGNKMNEEPYKTRNTRQYNSNENSRSLSATKHDNSARKGERHHIRKKADYTNQAFKESESGTLASHPPRRDNSKARVKPRYNRNVQRKRRCRQRSSNNNNRHRDRTMKPSSPNQAVQRTSSHSSTTDFDHES